MFIFLRRRYHFWGREWGESNVRLNGGVFPFFLDQTIFLFQRRNCVSSTNYLVDPASSHMLVSKIKPCMSKNKPLNGESANGSLNQLLFIWWYLTTWITVVILELIHAPSPDFGKGAFIRFKPSVRLGNWAWPLMVSHNNLANRMALSRRCFIQISALSAFDGRILAYHGYNG